jgi:hypothetical protein
MVRYLAAFEMLEQILTLLYQKENDKVTKKPFKFLLNPYQGSLFSLNNLRLHRRLFKFKSFGLWVILKP